jgi:uncharacterized protein
MKNPEVTTDLFTFPYKDKHILYAPFKHCMIMANDAVVNLVADIMDGSFRWNDNQDEKEIIKLLREKGILDSKPDKLPQSPNTQSFEPTAVTLFPTNQCNMRCIYCYASAGELTAKNMDWEVAKAAIDLVAHNSKKLKKKHFSVGFHGGGEPTLHWDFFTQCVEYAKHLSEESGIKAMFSAATNAVLRPEQMEWIIKNVNSLSISLDGPPDIQNLQRPMANGNESYILISENIKQLDAAQFSYGIRSTITTHNVKRMSEIIEHFSENYNTKQIHFEPLFLCGRCHTSSVDAPKPNTFIREFLKANLAAEKKNVKLAYSGLRLGGVTSTFCGACGSNFSVTPEGYVTSCFEVLEQQDHRANIFFFGKWHPQQKRFEIWQDKLDYLKSFNVQNIDYCQDCIAKWHCAGDCLAKVAYDSDIEGERGSERCQMNQEITKKRIIQLFKNPPKQKINKDSSIRVVTNKSES